MCQKMNLFLRRGSETKKGKDGLLHFETFFASTMLWKGDVFKFRSGLKAVKPRMTSDLYLPKPRQNMSFPAACLPPTIVQAQRGQ